MRLQEINQKLKLELATLKSPQNLEHLAIGQLGLSPPKPEQIILLP
jgi:cell division protein FtsL